MNVLWQLDCDYRCFTNWGWILRFLGVAVLSIYSSFALLQNLLSVVTVLPIGPFIVDILARNFSMSALAFKFEECILNYIVKRLKR